MWRYTVFERIHDYIENEWFLPRLFPSMLVTKWWVCSLWYLQTSHLKWTLLSRALLNYYGYVEIRSYYLIHRGRWHQKWVVLSKARFTNFARFVPQAHWFLTLKMMWKWILQTWFAFWYFSRSQEELGCREHSWWSCDRRLDGPKFCLSNVFIRWD